VQNVERDAADLDLVAIGERAVRPEGRIDEGLAEPGAPAPRSVPVGPKLMISPPSRA
jgi:hypothetical protein